MSNGDYTSHELLCLLRQLQTHTGANMAEISLGVTDDDRVLIRISVRNEKGIRAQKMTIDIDDLMHFAGTPAEYMDMRILGSVDRLKRSVSGEGETRA